MNEFLDEDLEFWQNQRLIEKQEYLDLYKDMAKKKSVKLISNSDEQKLEMDKIQIFM